LILFRTFEIGLSIIFAGSSMRRNKSSGTSSNSSSEQIVKIASVSAKDSLPLPSNLSIL